MAPIDLTNREVVQFLTILALLWGTAFALVLYEVAAEIIRLRSERKPRRERRFIEPCATDLHTYEEGVCTRCKATEPEPTTQP